MHAGRDVSCSRPFPHSVRASTSSWFFRASASAAAAAVAAASATSCSQPQLMLASVPRLPLCTCDGSLLCRLRCRQPCSRPVRPRLFHPKLARVTASSLAFIAAASCSFARTICGGVILPQGSSRRTRVRQGRCARGGLCELSLCCIRRYCSRKSAAALAPKGIAALMNCIRSLPLTLFPRAKSSLAWWGARGTHRAWRRTRRTRRRARRAHGAHG